MKRIIVLAVAMVLVVAAAGAQTSTRADAEPSTRSAKDVRGATPYLEIKNEPAPNAPAPSTADAGVTAQIDRGKQLYVERCARTAVAIA